MYNMPMPEGEGDLRLKIERKEESEKGKQKDYVYSSEKRYISYFQLPPVSVLSNPFLAFYPNQNRTVHKGKKKGKCMCMPEPKLSRSIQDLKFE